MTGSTLLHDALSQGKFDFAIELLKKGAHDYILDNDQLYDPFVSLETLNKAREYQDLKIELIIKNRKELLEIENKAARTIQSFWRRKHNIITTVDSTDADHAIKPGKF